MQYSEKISKKLNNLLEKTYDAEKGFKLAQDKIDNLKIKNFINDRAEQRSEFGHELKKEILHFGKLSEPDGRVRGNVHSAWMDLRGVLSLDETENLLEEVERGEKASLEEYNEIIRDKDMVLPPSTKSMLMRQRDAIKSSLTAANIHERMA